jgi:beta-lactamase regulating signal transducer with metallopeptidase domain
MNMSITASLIGLMLLVLRQVRKIPRFVIYLLWSPVLVRLLLPVGIASRYSFMNLLSQTLAKSVTVEGFSTVETTMLNYVKAADAYFPISYKTDLLQQVFRVSSVIWLVGAAAAVAMLVVFYASAGKAVKAALKPAGGYYVSSFSATPFVYGILQPKIIMPANVAEFNVTHVLAHENIHIRRLDNLWRMLALLAACIHWFNPLIWYFVKLFFNDMEFACDEKAVRNLTTDERREYASVMLQFAVKRAPAVSSAFGGTVIQKRIENVLSYKTMSLIGSICVALFIIVLGIALLTNASP